MTKIDPKFDIVPGEKNADPVVTFYTTREVEAYLKALVKSGLYGPSVAGVAERLVARGIEDLIMTGILDRES